MSATFGLGYTPGPEKKPWDGIMGYPTIHGRMDVMNSSFVNFDGLNECGAENIAITNYEKNSDAFHPHYFRHMDFVGLPVGRCSSCTTRALVGAIRPTAVRPHTTQPYMTMQVLLDTLPRPEVCL